MENKKKERNQNSFCRGIICSPHQRKVCKKCFIYVCAICSLKIKNKIYCIDCAIEIFLEQEKGGLKEAFKKLGF